MPVVTITFEDRTETLVCEKGKTIKAVLNSAGFYVDAPKAKPNSTEVSDCVCGFLLLNKHYYSYNLIVRDGVCGEVRSIKAKKSYI